MTYRTELGTTIVREDLDGRVAVVAVVALGDTALAERIARLLTISEHTDAAETPTAAPDVFHLIRDGSATTACCYRTPFELRYYDGGHRLTVDPDAVTCGIAPPERKIDERVDTQRRVAELAGHRPSSLGGDGLGYGPCVGCGELWPCKASRAERKADRP